MNFLQCHLLWSVSVVSEILVKGHLYGIVLNTLYVYLSCCGLWNIRHCWVSVCCQAHSRCNFLAWLFNFLLNMNDGIQFCRVSTWVWNLMIDFTNPLIAALLRSNCWCCSFCSTWSHGNAGLCTIEQMALDAAQQQMMPPVLPYWVLCWKSCLYIFLNRYCCILYCSHQLIPLLLLHAMFHINMSCSTSLC
jgi:hypothetical protein